jgi:hypothetical protein
MSEWRDEINRKGLARLDKALPDVFPTPVLTHAMGRRFTPPMPRLAIDSYWRAHPVRADSLARALSAKSGGPAGWKWRLGDKAGSRETARPHSGRCKTGLAGGELPGSAGALSGAPLFARSRLLLHLRPAGLPVRLACGPVGLWREPECRLASRLRGRLELVDGAKRSCARPQAPAATALRGNRREAMEDRRGRPPRPAIPGVA